MTTPKELSGLLASAQHRLRPTDPERDRIHAALLDALDPEAPLTATSGPSDFTNELVPGRVDLLPTPFDAYEPKRPDRRSTRYRILLTAAAALLVIVGVGRWLGSGELDQVNTTEFATPPTVEPIAPSPASSPEPKPDALTPTAVPATVVVATEIGRGAGEDSTLQPGTYSLTLGDYTVIFDLYDERVVRHLNPDTIVFESITRGSSGTYPRLALAIATAAFEGYEPAAWLDTRAATLSETASLVDGALAADFEIGFDSPGCQPAEPCQELPVMLTDSDLLMLVDGPNRLLVHPLEEGSTLLVLDTSGGNRSGASQRAYNTLVASLALEHMRSD